MNKTELLELLNKTEEKTLSFFDLPEMDLQKSYADGKWNIRQLLHHLADCELIFLGRLKKIIAEPFQVIWAFDQDEWDRAFDYKNQSLNGKKELYSLCRKMNYDLVNSYYDTFWQKEFVHSETGMRTLKMEFDKVAVHNQAHNEQIKVAMAR